MPSIGLLILSIVFRLKVGGNQNKLNLIKGNAELIDTERSYIHTTHRMVSLIGMEDTVVIETKDAVLVANLNKVQDVKNLVQKLEKEDRAEVQHHREKFRPW